MDIHYGFSVNGVATLHTDILKNEELKHFNDIYPEKFNNKTNGITFRRWLIHCNNELANYISELINKDWFMTLLDIEEYIKTKELVFKDYEDRETWNKKAAIAAFFT